MGYQVALLNFEGPLDLLLQLIERARLDAADISLAQVTEQYLSYTTALSNLELDETARFTALAAKLLYIKSAGLLPEAIEEVIEETEELERQLAEYRHYQTAATTLGDLLRQPNRGWSRSQPQRPARPALPTNLTATTLQRALHDASERLAAATDHAVTAPQVSLEVMTSRLEGYTASQNQATLGGFLSSLDSRIEQAVAVMAALELWRLQRLQLVQSDHFGHIKLTRTHAAAR